MPRCKTKAIVFDLDDTIGHFEQLSLFLHGLERALIGFNERGRYFSEIMNLFPEFIRPGIIDSLKLLRKRKKRDKCLKVIIYTNNNGSRGWTLAIKNYLEQKIKGKVFDRIITKYDRHSVINCRTTHNKTHKDLVSCSKLPEQTQYLFLDDQYHPFMHHKNIQYLQLSPYNYRLSADTMIKRFLQSSMGKALPKDKHAQFSTFIKKVLRSEKDYIVRKSMISKKDKKERKRLLKEIKKFTMLHKQTRKFHKKKGKQTRRNYI